MTGDRQKILVVLKCGPETRAPERRHRTRENPSSLRESTHFDQQAETASWGPLPMHHEEKQQDQAEQDEERPRSLRRQAISDALAGVIENSGVTHETEHQTNLRRWPVSVTLRS